MRVTVPPAKAVALGAMVVGLIVALAIAMLAGPWRNGYREGPPSFAVKSTGSRPPLLVAVVPGTSAPVPTEAGLAQVLGPLLAGGAVGERVGVSVVDAATGRTLFARDADNGFTPASSTKVVTAVAALTALGPEHRFTTRVVQGAAPDRIVLVGGGDPTLSAVPGLTAGPLTPARMTDLAKATADALRQAGTTAVDLQYDTTLYGSGPNPPGWSDDFTTKFVAPVTSLMADGGRITPDGEEVSPRVTEPATEAAAAFAKLLTAQGITVRGTPVPVSTVPVTATGVAVPQPGTGQTPVLASVSSPTVAALVERMLANSDNDIAEAFGRQIAVRDGKPATAAGAPGAVLNVLTRLGVPVAGITLHDGSGLSEGNRIPPTVLTHLLTLAASPDRPELRPVLTGLPVAGFTGTLAERYTAAETVSGAGLVRAKTGTLIGVSSLAGVVRDADGRLLAFAFMADRTSIDTEAARKALDRMATAVSACGCH